MKTRLMLGLLGLLSAAACAADADSRDERAERQDVEELGTLSLALTGTDTSGRTYRLRDAEFEIRGYPDMVEPSWEDGGFPSPYYKLVGTESDPDAATITERVVPGSYQVYFLSYNWYLERLVNGAWERVEQAVLLSSRFQSAYVYNDWVERVAYRFGVDGELIDFRAGEIEIDIEIEQPGEGPGTPTCPQIPGFPFPLPCPVLDGGLLFPPVVDSGTPPWPEPDARAAEPESGDAGAL